jgi:predicted NAD/FAD-binding protein
VVASLPDVRLSTPVRAVRRRPTHVEVDSVHVHAERFDAVVLACHSDQSRVLLGDATPKETALLNCIDYQPNRVVLHTDAALMPRRRRAWSAWNYRAQPPHPERPVSVTYWLNRLQPLPFQSDVMITLNPDVEPRADSVLAEFEYSHPIVKGRAAHAQREFESIQGQRRTWFAGAWLGHGFHEDGLASAHAVAQGFLARAASDERERAVA